MPPPKDPEKFKLWRQRQIESQKKSAKRGELSPCFKKKVEKICPVCGKGFLVKPSHSDQICCTKKCMGIRKSETDCGENNNFYGRKHTQSTKEALKEKQTGVILSDVTKKKMSVKKKGIPHTKEHSENIGKALAGREITWTDKISAAHQGLSLEEWEGFITPLYQKIRASPEYDTWRRAVFERDNYCDWFSGIKSTGNLNAHHIVPFAVILEQNNIKTFEEALSCAALWDVANGVTMIDTVHTAYHQMW